MKKKKPTTKYTDINGSDNWNASGAGRATFRRSANLMMSADLAMNSRPSANCANFIDTAFDDDG